jgi:hypothetical protein
MQHETANAGDGHASGRACAAHAVRRGIALLSAGAAAIHISTADEHGALFGAAFIAMALFQAAWAARLVQRPSRSLLVAGIAGQLAIVATWAVAHTVGLPFGPGAGQAEAIGRKDLIATGLELLAVLGAIGLLVPASARMLARSSLPAYQPAAGGLVAMALAAVAVATPHGATPHGHGGGHDDAHAATGVAHGHGAGQAHAPGGRGHAHTPADSAGGHEHSSDSRRDHAAHPTLASAHAGGRGEHASLDRHGTGHAGSSGGHGDGDGHAGSGGGHVDDDGDGGRAHERGHGRRGERGHGERDHGERGHGDGGHAPDEHGRGHGPDGAPPEDHDAPGGARPWSGRWESAEPARDGGVGRGAALTFTGPEGGGGHAHGAGGCEPTPEQRARADALHRETAAVLKRYDNAPQRALADGFTYVVGPTDRIIHMVNVARMREPTILDAAQIESFLYVVTDAGLTPVGGMYIMPQRGMPGPEIGGCLTRWHAHAGFGGRALTLGTADRTPEMLHVYVHPRLDPWTHYSGRDLSQLSSLGRHVPSVCFEGTGDGGEDFCVP